MKHLALLLFTFTVNLHLLFAAVPVKWTVETSRLNEMRFEAYHGEALGFEVAFNALGTPLDLASHTATLYYQTNGMDQAWWSVPGTVSGNVARVTFTPDMDPGAKQIQLFIGLFAGPSNLNYRAAARVTFRNSPGATTNVIDRNIVTLDFSKITTMNAPWYTKHEANDANNAILTAAKDYTDDATNATLTAAKDYADSTTNGISSTVSSHSSLLSQLSQSNTQLALSVDAISTHLNAEDAHFVSTNYDSTVRTPEAYVEVKVDGSWLTIWKEMTRWTKFVGSAFDWDAWAGFHTWGTNVTANISALWDTKADRCWGIYDSETGGYSPDGVTQISSSNILIAANMAYQRNITTAGAVWVLQCNSGHAVLNGDTNGYFRVSDGTGSVQFEIIQGSQQELGADSDGFSISGTTATIHYSVDADDSPTLKICTDLSTRNWKTQGDADCVANVSWSGSRGNWVATVTPKTVPCPQMFITATYMAGGETYINNRAPVSMSSIYLNGTKYYLGTNTINGVTVMTLSTTAP